MRTVLLISISIIFLTTGAIAQQQPKVPPTPPPSESLPPSPSTPPSTPIPKQQLPTLPPQKIPSPQVLPQPITDIYIRGLVYKDHSKNTRLSTNAVKAGSSFQIISSTLDFTFRSYEIRVILEDVQTPSQITGGETAIRLTQTTPQGKNNLNVFVPNYGYLKKRKFRVTLFFIGPQPWLYAFPGTISIQ